MTIRFGSVIGRRSDHWFGGDVVWVPIQIPEGVQPVSAHELSLDSVERVQVDDVTGWSSPTLTQPCSRSRTTGANTRKASIVGSGGASRNRSGSGQAPTGSR